MMLPIIGITQGEEKGIGPEIIQKALSDHSLFKICRPLVIGKPTLFKFPKSCSVSIVPPLTSQTSSLGALKQAFFLWTQGKISAIATAPVDKYAISRQEKIHFLGHTGFFKKECEHYFKKSFYPIMFFVSGYYRLALATTHIPLSQVPRTITKPLLKKTILTVHKNLKTYFGINHPRLSILGLNPHAGEGGLLGMEEKNILHPIVLWAKRNHMSLEGPFPTDSYFSIYWRSVIPSFDATIALYHDQGLSALKLKHFHHAVNVTLGLPLIRTSVDHGVGYDIANTHKANPISMIEAIKLASFLVKKRKSQ